MNFEAAIQLLVYEFGCSESVLCMRMYCIPCVPCVVCTMYPTAVYGCVLKCFLYDIKSACVRVRKQQPGWHQYIVCVKDVYQVKETRKFYFLTQINLCVLYLF